MIDHTLVVPNDISTFEASLKTLLLYGDSITTFLPTTKAAYVGLEKLFDEAEKEEFEGYSKASVKRIGKSYWRSKQYLTHAKELLNELAYLKKEGALISVGDTLLDQFTFDVAQDSTREQSESILHQVNRRMITSVESFSHFSYEEMIALSKIAQELNGGALDLMTYYWDSTFASPVAREAILTNQDLATQQDREALVDLLLDNEDFGYGCLLSAFNLAEFLRTSSVTPCTTHVGLHKALNGSSLTSSLKRKRSAESVDKKFASQIISNSVPAVNNLSFEDVVELRRLRFPEIKNLRVEIDRLAQDVDFSENEVKVRKRVNELTKTIINPALADLRSSISNHRRIRDAQKRNPDKLIVGATVTFIASLFGEFSWLTTGSIGTGVASLTKKVYDDYVLSKIHEDTKFNSSRFSILLRIEEAVENRTKKRNKSPKAD